MFSSGGEEIVQDLVDLVGDQVVQGVGAAGDQLQGAVLEKLDGFMRAGADGYDLVIFAAGGKKFSR